MQLAAALNNIITFYSADVGTSSYNDDYLGSGSSFGRKKMRRFFRNSALLPFIIVGVVLLVILFLSWGNIFGSSNAPAAVGAKDKRVDIAGPKSQQVLNRSFEFPLKDQSGKEVSKLKYELQGAELRDEIVVKGEKATAVKGRTFLIVNIKITNNYDKNIQVNVKDYIRLIINNSNDKLAADIHNDPVDVQAISTKITRVGFPISDTDKNLTIQIGEIQGSKQSITLDLK